MIKTWVNKALILAYVTLFCFLGISTKVHAERLYILDNLLQIEYLESSDYAKYSGFTVNLEEDHQYYVSRKITYISGTLQNVSGKIVSLSPYYHEFSDNILGYDNYTNSKITKWTYPNQTRQIFIYGFSGVNGSINSIWENIIFLDLTAIFGWGSEPTLQDFELYYLPDLDYFDTYNSFEPEMTTSISDISYSNLNENLKVIDYTKSIIDNDGRNIDLDLSLYFYDINTIPGYVQAYYYKENNHPTMKYNGVEYVLNWVYSDYSQRVLILELTDEEELILKKILFNRYIDRGEEYFNFKAEMSYTTAKMWFTIGSKFDLLVDVKSFLLSRETITENDFNIVNEMYIKTYDQSDNLLLPSLKLDISDLFRTIYVGDFGSKYTNISKFNFEFLLVSPTIYDTYTEENHYFYEIGIFSSDKVLHPSFIESDIDSLWDLKTCDWYQIGCHLSNFANEVLTTTYNKLNIDAIIAFFDGIIDDVTQVVDTVPSGVKTVLTVLFSGLGVALIIVIIEKMNR